MQECRNWSWRGSKGLGNGNYVQCTLIDTLDAGEECVWKIRMGNRKENKRMLTRHRWRVSGGAFLVWAISKGSSGSTVKSLSGPTSMWWTLEEEGEAEGGGGSSGCVAMVTVITPLEELLEPWDVEVMVAAIGIQMVTTEINKYIYYIICNM